MRSLQTLMRKLVLARCRCDILTRPLLEARARRGDAVDADPREEREGRAHLRASLAELRITQELYRELVADFRAVCGPRHAYTVEAQQGLAKMGHLAQLATA